MFNKFTIVRRPKNTHPKSKMLPIRSILTKNFISGIIVRKYKIPVNLDRENPTEFNGTNISKLMEKKKIQSVILCS